MPNPQHTGKSLPPMKKNRIPGRKLHPADRKKRLPRMTQAPILPVIPVGSDIIIPGHPFVT